MPCASSSSLVTSQILLRLQRNTLCALGLQADVGSWAFWWAHLAQEYKRQLGHRIYTREEFLQRLKLERGRALQLEGGTAWNFEGTFDEALGTDRRLAEIK